MNEAYANNWLKNIRKRTSDADLKSANKKRVKRKWLNKSTLVVFPEDVTLLF